MLPEMWKMRPVLVVSYRNTLSGPCLVLPVSTDPQEGQSAEWAHKLSFQLTGSRDNWVVCNHLYTVSPSRLSAFPTPIPRLAEDEFSAVLTRAYRWLPQAPEEPKPA